MRIRYAALALIVTFLVAGGAIGAIWGMRVAHIVWMAATVLMGAPLVLRTLWNMAHGHFATDIVASMSIVGAVWLDQPLAGLVVVLMQTGGEALERYAEGRASAAVRDLEAAAPRVAHIMERGAVRDVAATTVAIGDTLLVRPGDLVPCDGTIIDGESELDTSSLTGEAIPTRASAGVSVMSGMLNGLGSFTMSVSALAAKSQYARIVELVRTAQSSKAPLQRLADKYAVWFTPFTIVMCAAAVLITHDWVRALAILVVATPCPLILATPVAIIGGINRAAKRFVIVRNGGALEQLAKVDAAVFDKTGTITVGQPRVSSVRVPAGFDEKTVMGLAAAVEQHSSHLLARVLVDRVTADGKALATSISNVETPGQGVTGVVDGRVVRVGARAFVVPE
ncbi:MAG: HAD-IC family P-type ATPase, partial [Gemmatimonadaceae bacterium]